MQVDPVRPTVSSTSYQQISLLQRHLSNYDQNVFNTTTDIITYNFNTAKLASKSYVFSDACAKTYCSNIFRFSGLYLQKQNSGTLFECTPDTKHKYKQYEINEFI